MAPEFGLLFPPEVTLLLVELGLSPTEIRTYEFLHRAPSSLASVIARETQQSRGRVYETTRELVKKGFVVEEPSDPIQFHPVPLRTVFRLAREAAARRLDAVSASEAAATQLHGLSEESLEVRMRPKDVAVFTGRRACVEELARMVTTAKTFFWIMGRGKIVARLSKQSSLVHAAAVSSARGVDVRLFLPERADEAPLSALKEKLGEEALVAVPPSPAEPLLHAANETTAFDVFVQPDDENGVRGDDVGIRVQALVAVRHARAKISAQYGPQEEPPMSAIYQWLGPNHGTDRFLEGITNSRSEINVVGPDNWTRYLGRTWDETIRACRAARSRGVRMRAVMAAPVAATMPAPEFLAQWDIRIVPWIPVWLTVIDRQELFMSFPPATAVEPAQFRASVEPHETRFYSEVFNRLWSVGRPFAQGTAQSQELRGGRQD